MVRPHLSQLNSTNPSLSNARMPDPVTAPPVASVCPPTQASTAPENAHSALQTHLKLQNAFDSLHLPLVWTPASPPRHAACWSACTYRPRATSQSVKSLVAPIPEIVPRPLACFLPKITWRQSESVNIARCGMWHCLPCYPERRTRASAR